MNSYKKLMNNSIVFAIGNLGTKLVNFILVPLYTYYLSTADYGIGDLVLTTTNMLLPVVTLSIFDAVLRYVMGKDETKEKILYNSLVISFVGNLIFCIAILVISAFVKGFSLKTYLFYILAILVLQTFQMVLAQYIRAIGKVKAYAANGIITAAATGILSIITLAVFDMGLTGYLVSIVLSNLISLLFLCFFVDFKAVLKKSNSSKELRKGMIHYSLPLIPNSLMWWLINAANRYVVAFFLGTSITGLFAAANKIPTLLAVISSIFIQAWQMSAIETYKEKNVETFYRNIFNIFSFLLSVCTFLILMFIQPITRIVLDVKFYDAWKFIPFLLLANLFSSYASFLGTNYIVIKETKGVLRTSIIGGIINVVCCAGLVPLIGGNGASIASFLGFFVMFIMRYIDAKRLALGIELKLVFWNLGILLILTIAIFLIPVKSVLITTQGLLFVLLIIVNKKIIKEVLNILQKAL